MSYKRPYAKIKHEYNPAFDRLLHDANQGKLNKRLSAFMTRPAYAYTSMEQKRIYKQNPCNGCGYYYKTDNMPKLDCTFPWDDPKDYDKAVYDYLPCMEGKANEED